MGTGMGVQREDEPTFTIVSISLAGDGDGYLLELFDSKVIEEAKKQRASRRERWDSMERIFEPGLFFPSGLPSQRVFIPVTNRQFMRLSPFVGMTVKVNVLPAGT